MTHVSKALVLFLLLLAGCAEESEFQYDEEAALQAIEEMSANRAEAFRRGDADAIASHFSANGVLMAPNFPSQIGQEAVRDHYQAIFDEYETDLSSYYEEVSVSGNLAFGRGVAEVTLILRESGEVITATSKYLNILQRDKGGSWKTTHDIWNSNE